MFKGDQEIFWGSILWQFSCNAVIHCCRQALSWKLQENGRALPTGLREREQLLGGNGG
jgi:hypothetical protein